MLLCKYSKFQKSICHDFLGGVGGGRNSLGMFSYTAIVIKWIELKVIYDCNRHRNPINRSIKSLFTQMEKYSNRKEKKQHIPDN